jgi:hypothetical protein
MRREKRVGPRAVYFAASSVAVGLLASVMSGQARGDTLFWTGSAGDQEFFAAGNWSPSESPSSGDNINILDSSVFPLFVDNNQGTASFSNLSLFNFNGNLQGINGQDNGNVDFTVSSGVSIDGFGAVTTSLNNINLSSPAPILIQGDLQFNLSNSTLQSDFSLEVGAGGPGPQLTGTGNLVAPTVELGGTTFQMTNTTITTQNFSADSSSTVNMSSGDVIFMNTGLTIGPTGNFSLPDSTANLTTLRGGTVQVSGGTVIQDDSALVIDDPSNNGIDPTNFFDTGTVPVTGATLYTDTLALGNNSQVGLTAGHIHLTSQDIDISSSGVFGQSLTLGNEQALSTDQNTTIANGSSLTIDYGQLATQNVIVAPGGSFNFVHGSLFMNDSLEVGATGLVGSLDLQPTDFIVDRSTVTIDSGASVTLDGGLFYANNLTGGGTFNFNKGTFLDLSPISIGAGEILPSGTTVGINFGTSPSSFDEAGGVTVDAGSSFSVIDGLYIARGLGFGTDVGGTLNVGATVVGSFFSTNNLKIETTGTVNISGLPSFLAVDSLVNNGHLNITSSGGAQEIRAFSPNGITNNGTLKVTGTTVIWDQSFTNNGAYISDPASSHFTDLNVGTGGYLQGGAGDQFIVSGSFENSSTDTTDWDTHLSSLIFAGDPGTSHEMISGSTDEGASDAGTSGNFAWGSLELASGNTLLVEDDPIYVLGLLLDDGAPGLTNIDLADGGMIYYDVNDQANAYLDGQTITTEGGGKLVPFDGPEVAVPEPASGLMVVLGVGGLLSRRTRRRV